MISGGKGVTKICLNPLTIKKEILRQFLIQHGIQCHPTQKTFACSNSATKENYIKYVLS